MTEIPNKQLDDRLQAAGIALKWTETILFSWKTLSDLEPDNIRFRLESATVLSNAERPQKAIERLEWVLAKEPANADAQTLLKNTSVTETLQRGNWENTDTTFH
tara:strand:+ start:978 stop:1289 length:312 start_codon:yes stop_codon:yes gene_type:complete